MIGIVDYEGGNARSVLNAIEYLGHDCVLTAKREKLDKCSHIILPGVGAFEKVMGQLEQKDLIAILNDLIIKDKRFYLGLCIGMQIMFEEGTEYKECRGLGWIEGRCEKLGAENLGLTLPHVGWSSVEVDSVRGRLFDGLGQEPTFYFVHSYAIKRCEGAGPCVYAKYGERFICAVEKENMFGVQFHPEKSQKDGLRLLSNFCNLT